ncbi:MAG: UvrB/UvrC motif-containing protein [Gemmataceae bacterium]|nr:UvrB/UvrC motif-containing protein [Gemmataceae bacterium]MDW8243348.1 UvrB/UvrC motif-containing protein [Thermogemmata sp.]
MSQHPTDGRLTPLFPTQIEKGFGASRYRPPEELPVVGVCQGRGRRLEQQVRSQVPCYPGVYGMYDVQGRLLYIGKAKQLRQRLLSYFRSHSRPPKAEKIIAQTRRLVWESCGDEFAALLRELELIQTLLPRYNVVGLPGRQRYHYVCLTPPPASYLQVTPQPPRRALAVYGPLALRRRSEEAVRRLNDWFGLRDCSNRIPLHFRDQSELFAESLSPGCLRWELQQCLGPCVAACSRQEYQAAVNRLRAFLDGRDRSLLTTLRQRMQEAAERLEYEKALALRDRLTALEWLDARLRLLRQARRGPTWVYPLTGWDGQQRWYLLHRGQVVAVCFAAAAPAECIQLLRRHRISPSRSTSDLPQPPARVDTVLLVAAWFRHHPDEQQRLLTPAQILAAAAACTDTIVRSEQ